jgi:hypothetical protein
MRYYLGFVLFGLLMSGLCMVFEVHTTWRTPAPAMFGLFGASADRGAAPGGGPAAVPPDAALPA